MSLKSLLRAFALASATLAFAGYCQTDEGTPSIASESGVHRSPSPRPLLDVAIDASGTCPTGVPYSPRRPILGHVNIRPSVLTGMAEEEWGSPAAVDRLMKLLLHEVLHEVGSPPLRGPFLDTRTRGCISLSIRPNASPLVGVPFAATHDAEPTSDQLGAF